jgi:hypothetical protein
MATSSMRTRPAATEYAAYYETYVSKVPESDVVAVLDAQLGETLDLIRSIPEPKAGYRYAPDKWSVRQLVGHVIDSERVFAYRTLRIARGDQTPLAGFDQETFMAGADFDAYSLEELAAEFEHVRRATLALLSHLRDDAWSRTGVASDNEVSVRGLAYIMAGHVRHHMGVLTSRYLGR